MREFSAFFLATIALVLSVASIAAAQGSARADSVVLWEQSDIADRDLYWGPGGRLLLPNTKRVRLINRKVGGSNLKFKVEDASERIWIVKAADESRPEISANRLLWALGYKTEIDYFVRTFTARGFGTFHNVRFELRSDDVKRGHRWSWSNNPFRNSREMAGLRIFMALINNWDLRDENTITFIRDGRTEYVVSDLGSSFGRLADSSLSRSGRNVGHPDDYAEAPLVKGVNNGILELNYRGKNENLMKGLKVEDARWFADLLLQLSDTQISDAFRAAGFKHDDVALYTRAFKSRIGELKKATR